MKQTLTAIRNITHTYPAGTQKKVKISNSIDSINVVGSGSNTIKDQLVEFNTGEYLTTISDGCFSGCKHLQKVTLQARTVNIGENAFKDCEKLEDINIETVTFQRIGDNAFENTGLSNLNMQLFTTPSGQFGKQLFKSCKKLKSVVLTANYVPEAMFADCSCLTAIDITLSSGSADGTTEIDINALSGIPYLQSIAIRGRPSTLPHLSGMHSLSNVTLELGNAPAIPDYMLSDTPMLKTIDFSNCIYSPSQLALNAFSGSSLTSIVMKTVTKAQLQNSMQSENLSEKVDLKHNYIEKAIVQKEDTGNKYCYGKIYDDVGGILDFAISSKIPLLIINAYRGFDKANTGILNTKLFYRWLARQMFLVVVATDNIQITDIYNYFQGDEWDTTMYNPFYGGRDAYTQYGGSVWSCGYGGRNIIEMKYDGTTQVQLYPRGVKPNTAFVQQYNKIDMPNKVYKFYNSNTTINSKVLTYDILTKQTGSALYSDLIKTLKYTIRQTQLKRLHTALQYEGERYDVDCSIRWPTYNATQLCLFVPYKNCTYTENSYVNAFNRIEDTSLDKPASVVQKNNNWNKMSKCGDVFKNTSVVQIKDDAFIWFNTSNTGVNRYCPIANGKLIVEDSYEIKSDGTAVHYGNLSSQTSEVRAAYDEYLKTDYAQTNYNTDSGAKNILKQLQLKIDTWLSAYTPDSNLMPTDYPTEEIDYSYIPTKPTPSNCWNIGHDCTITASGNVQVKWAETKKTFK